MKVLMKQTHVSVD